MFKFKILSLQMNRILRIKRNSDFILIFYHLHQLYVFIFWGSVLIQFFQTKSHHVFDMILLELKLEYIYIYNQDCDTNKNVKLNEENIN